MIGTSGDVRCASSMICSDAVVLAALAGDEEHVDVAALERADGLVDAVGDADELEAPGRRAAARWTSKTSSPSTATSARMVRRPSVGYFCR